MKIFGYNIESPYIPEVIQKLAFGRVQRLLTDLASVNFGDYFDRCSVCFWGVISTKCILPPKNKPKIGQNNPQNRRSRNPLTVSQSAENRFLKRGLVSDCVNSFKYLNSDLPGEQSAERDSNLHQVVETVAKLQLSFLPFPICPDIDKKHIRDLIITLDDGSILSLSAKMSRLAEIGDQIAHLHPMTFIKETLSDPNLRKRMKRIFSHPLKRTGIMTGSGFRKGFNHHLTKAANIGELDTYIESFANSLHVSAKEIKPLIQSHEWTNLYVYLIEKTCAREDL